MIDQIENDIQSILTNIEWNLGGLIGLGVLYSNPKIVFLQNAPLTIDVEGLKVDGFQAMGISLLEKDRKCRIDETFALAKRMLICEALETSADYLYRLIEFKKSGEVPYESESILNVSISDLFNSTKGKSGSLLIDEERKFIRVFVKECG